MYYNKPNNGGMVYIIQNLELTKNVIYWKFLRAYMMKELWNLEVLAFSGMNCV